MFKDDLLKGKRILVTGGGTGLGKEMASHYAQHGAELYICGRRENVLKETSDQLKSEYGVDVHYESLDIRASEDVDGYIQRGIDEGAKRLSGGISTNKQKGFVAKPTLFDGLKENMTIAQEEIFGPVLGVLTVKDDNEALKVASNSKYGLHASVFTQDINRAFHLAKSLPCGTVSVNTFSEGDIKTPFGGYKQSGSLSRDQGTEALNSFLQTKTIWISHQ